MRLRLAILLVGLLTVAGVIAFRRMGSTAQEKTPVSGASTGTQRPNILLISVDTLRADHLSCYGYDRPTSPNIDRLARDSVVFEDAMSVTSWTLPSHLSMLTSLYPQVHGVMEGQMRLPEKAKLCTELMKAAGYSTFGVVAAPFLNHQFGYSQGFDLYEDFSGGDKDTFDKIRRAIQEEVPAKKIHHRALEILDGRKTGPFFMFLHYFDPHLDYSPPPPYDTMFDPDYEKDLNGRKGYDSHDRVPLEMNPRGLKHLVALYDGEIASVDGYIGKLRHYLREQQIYDDMLIIFTADHGEEFWEHGKQGHRKSLYVESVHVPLIVKFPHNKWKGRRIVRTVGTADIVPTIFAVAGIDPDPVFDGRNLVPMAQTKGSDAWPEMPYFFELDDKFEGVRLGNWKLLRQKSGPQHRKLFDLSSDPRELHNVDDTLPEKLAELEAILDHWRQTAAQKSGNIGRAQLFEYSRDMDEALEELGYVN